MITQTKDDKTNETADESVEIWKPWNVRPAFVFPGTQYSIKGYSLAALRTNFYIKELGIMLDAGLSSPIMNINGIFLTHCHSDHCANLPFHIYSKKENKAIPIYAPKEMISNLQYYIESAYMLSSDVDLDILKVKKEELYIHSFYKLISVQDGDFYDIELKNKKLTVEVIKCPHSVPCVGYGFSEKRIKLKEEFKNLSGKDIGELRKKGIEINYEQILPLFVYLGDTSKDIFNDWDRIKKYKTIMIECTFIKDDDLEQADKTFHMHWKYLEKAIKDSPENIFILYHFSQRYDRSELKAFFDKMELKNIVPWIN